MDGGKAGRVDLREGNSLLGVDLGKLVTTALIPLIGKGLSHHPGPDGRHREHRTYQLAAKAQDIGVVVLARELCTDRILTDAGRDASKLVGDHRRPVSYAIDEDTPFTLAAGDRLNQIGRASCRERV